MKSMLGTMLVLAANKHEGQFDKSGKPYILHPLAVMQMVDPADEELQCIALGHDLVEDTKTTWEELSELFTPRVVDGIRCLTKMPGETFEEYKARVKSNGDAIQVKIADLRHNSDITRLKGISEKDMDRMAKYHKMYIELSQLKST